MIEPDISLHIVIVDDNYDDHFFMKKSMSDYKNIKFTSLFNGEDIVNFLHRKGEFANVTGDLPDIVLLDINMPKLNGFEVSEVLRREAKFSHVHFAVLSSSILETFERCKNVSCHQKPLMSEQYREILEKIIEEWKEKNKVGK